MLENVARLLKEGPDYLDRACSVSEFSREVWDVNWGSRFPCANGSASDILFSYALRTAGKPIPATVDRSKSPKPEVSRAGSITGAKPKPTFSRPQVLHVIRCSQQETLSKHHRQNIRWVYDLVGAVLLLGGGIAAFAFGLYGTFAATVLSAIFQVIRCLIIVQPSSSYLLDNEQGKVPGCMLVASHQNASTWILFCGERGIVDGILNKNMIYSVESRFRWRAGLHTLIFSLRSLGVLQLLALTFVAAQRGWDGVGLLIFVVFAGLTESVIQKENDLADGWAKRYGVLFETRTFEFKGRVSMLGAIQIYKVDPTRTWMDDIIVPNQRRDIWLKMLSQEKYECEDDDPMWEAADNGVRSWVRFNLAMSRAAAKIMEDEIPLSPNENSCLTV